MDPELPIGQTRGSRSAHAPARQLTAVLPLLMSLREDFGRSGLPEISGCSTVSHWSHAGTEREAAAHGFRAPRRAGPNGVPGGTAPISRAHAVIPWSWPKIGRAQPDPRAPWHRRPL